MAHVIDLKKKKKEEAPAPPPLPAPPPAPPVTIKLDDTLRWVTPRVFRNEQSAFAYIFAVVLFGIAVLVGVVQRDVLFAGLLALMGSMVIVFRRQPVSVIEVEVSPLRITAGTRRYGYDEIKSFWIAYEPEYEIRELSLIMKQWYRPYVKLPLGQEDPVQVRAILLQFIPEVEHEETILHSF